MVRSFLIAAAALGASPLFAATPSDAPLSVSVSYADLNLASPAGQKAFNVRINRAVEQVCPELNSSMSSKLAANHCRREVSAQTKRQAAIVVAAATEQRRGSMTVVAAR